MQTEDTSLPLSGIVIVDLTRVLAGPYCTRLLSDMGARVIKIERPGSGDDTRRSIHQIEPGREDQSTYFNRVNAGKESVAIDLSSAEGIAVLLDLARHADVFIENFAPGVVGRLGCDYTAVRAVKPDIVYCSISGYGQTGPWRNRPAFAHTTNAISGLMYLEQGDAPNPHSSNLQAADVLAATHASTAIAGALLRRFRTHQGAHIDVSMLEALIAADSVTYPSVLNGGKEMGSPRPGMLVHGVAGRYIALQYVGGADLWKRLIDVMQRPELNDDPRFSSAENRTQNWRVLRDLIGLWLEEFPSVDAALAVLEKARVPCAPVLSPAEVIASAHLSQRAFFPLVPHLAAGQVRVTASPYHLDGHPVHPQGPAARLVGEHTCAVLSGFLGYEESRISGLLARGAVAAPGTKTQP